MPDFRFVARDSLGELLDGTITAADRAAAILQVERKGVVPISIQVADTAKPSGEKPTVEAAPKPVSVPTALSTAGGSTELLSHAQRHLFTEQLAHLLGAGMTLDESLAVLVKRMKQVRLQSLSQGLHRALIEGRSLSQAMREYPRIFSPLYVNLVSAGEASGALSEILHRLVSHLADIKKLRDRVTQALIYPAVLVVAGIGLVITFMTVMVPKLTTFFKGSSQALPPATRLLINLNEWFVHYWWAALAAGGLAYAGFRVGTSSPTGRIAWDAFVWRIPLYGRILRFRFYAQFARTLGTLLENGVTLLKALELLEEISGNTWVRSRMYEARHAVIDGATLSVALGRIDLFPDLLLDMLSVGEQTGKVDSAMHLIASVFERELDRQIQIVSSLIPPIVMFVIAAIVGLVVYGIMSAVFGLTQNLRTQVH